MANHRKYPKGYYTYIFYDVDIPVYVGAGKGSRIYMSRWRLGLHNCSVRVILADSREIAFAKEAELILLYGRLDLGTGTLLNQTNGLGSSGLIISDEAHTRRSASAKLRERFTSQEERNRRSERMRQMNILNPPQRGRFHARNPST